jgi:hypothetical protein
LPLAAAAAFWRKSAHTFVPAAGSLPRLLTDFQQFLCCLLDAPAALRGHCAAEKVRTAATAATSLAGKRRTQEIWFKPKPASAKFLDGLIDPPSLPKWLTAEDLDYYVSQYELTGFRGPINWHRNIDRNVEITPQLEDVKIEQAAFFIAGKKDLVLSFAAGSTWS